MDQPRQIIIRTPNWLGDHIMALSFYQGLREGFPESSLVGLMPSSLIGLIPKNLFNEEWGFDKAHLKQALPRKKLIQDIHQKRFDWSINLNSSWSSHLLFFKAKIPRRIGFSLGGSGLLTTQYLSWQGVAAGKHKSALYLELLALLGISRSIKQPGFESIKSTPDNYVVLAPGASLPLREWPYYLELLLELQKRFPQIRFKLVGTQLEAAWKSRMDRLKLDRVDDLIGKTSVAELMELCSRARLVIANDSGVGHLAATLAKAPTLVIFGPGNPQYIAPTGSQVFQVKPQGVLCSPCEKAFCRAPMGYQECLKQISPSQVLEVASRILSL